MKYAFKTQMKQVYGAKAMPSYIVNSSSRYFAISGAGNPNEAEFSERVGGSLFACLWLKNAL